MATSTLTTINISTQKTTVEAEYKALIAGCNGELATVDSFVLLGVTYTRAELVAKLQKRVDAAEATKTSRLGLRSAVAAEKAVAKEVDPLRAALKTFLQGRYGKDSPKLQTFGFTQAKTPQKSADTKALSVAKAKATRKARGTMSKKQKKGIKGTVATAMAGGTVATTAPASAATPAPAPAASPAQPPVVRATTPAGTAS